MKIDKSKDASTQPQTQMQFPFAHLLPTIPLGGLTPEHWLALAERLRLATAALSDSPVLNQAESQSFRQNCDVIRMTGISLQLRNYSLLEVYEAEQWRDKFQSMKDFAKKVASLSNSQLMKCIDSARISLLMAAAGLGAVAPRGRQVEELAKVAPDHRLAAWQAVLLAFELHGNSISEAKHALINYCDANGIRFGRREPNGAKKGCHGSIMQPDHSTATVETPLQQSERSESKDWTENLAGTEDRTLIDILHLDILERFFGEFDGASPGKMIGKILQEIGSDHHNDQASEHMEAALSLVSAKEPALEEKLRKMALGLLAQAISQKLEHTITESRIAWAERLENDYPTINNSMPCRIIEFKRASCDEFGPVSDNRKGSRR